MSHFLDDLRKKISAGFPSFSVYRKGWEFVVDVLVTWHEASRSHESILYGLCCVAGARCPRRCGPSLFLGTDALVHLRSTTSSGGFSATSDDLLRLSARVYIYVVATSECVCLALCGPAPLCFSQFSLGSLRRISLCNTVFCQRPFFAFAECHPLFLPARGRSTK